MGGSAGGHLALMGGLLINDHRFDKNCRGVENIKVAAIVDKYGITDVVGLGLWKNITSKSAVKWLGDKAPDKDICSIGFSHNLCTKNSPAYIYCAW